MGSNPFCIKGTWNYLILIEKNKNIAVIALYRTALDKGAVINPNDLIEGFAKIEDFTKLPKMQKKVTLEELRSFFRKKIAQFAKMFKEK